MPGWRLRTVVVLLSISSRDQVKVLYLDQSSYITWNTLLFMAHFRKFGLLDHIDGTIDVCRADAHRPDHCLLILQHRLPGHPQHDPPSLRHGERMPVHHLRTLHRQPSSTRRVRPIGVPRFVLGQSRIIDVPRRCWRTPGVHPPSSLTQARRQAPTWPFLPSSATPSSSSVCTRRTPLVPRE